MELALVVVVLALTGWVAWYLIDDLRAWRESERFWERESPKIAALIAELDKERYNREATGV